MAASVLPPKQDLVKIILSEDWVSVHFNPKFPGVQIPEFLAARTEPFQVFQYGYDQPVPIPDLKIDAKGISATLSFQRVPYYTFLPWGAVFLITNYTDGRGVKYDEDIPAGVFIQVATGDNKNPIGEHKATDRNRLASVPMADSSAEEKTETERPRPVLRIIK